MKEENGKINILSVINLIFTEWVVQYSLYRLLASPTHMAIK